jgi:predicted 3-demethylubiquinone-9 3-methyltransferase (glyoxalase superfamily)
MQKIIPFLWFDGRAQEAIKFYTSIFKNSKAGSTNRFGENINSGTFFLDGMEFIAFDGGPMFTFNEAISLFVSCETQEEIDDYWDKLSEGGQKSRCGWLKDRFGVSWQVVPPVLGELLRDKDPKKSKRVMDAMLQMSKIDIAMLWEAYNKA